MNIAIIDDMRMEIDILKEILADYAKLHNLDFSVDAYTDASAFLDSFNPFSYTILFIDIYMEDIDGIEVATKVREIDSNVTMVFLTSSSDHMLEAFKFHAYDYITKPATPARIFQLLDDLLEDNLKDDDSFLDFTCNKTHYHMAYSEIMAVYTSEANYITIIDKDATSYKIRQTFAAISEMLEYDDRFLVLLRGILVNMDYIVSIKDNSCYLKNDVTLPANVRYFKKICHTFDNYRLIKEQQKSRAKYF